MAQLTCQKLCVGYDGKPVLQDLDFEVFAGDYLCIVGENGSGKSTLMKTILGLQPPISGRILTGDGLRKNEIGYLPQQTVVQKDFPASVREIVLSGCQGRCGSRPFYNKEEKQLAAETMDKMQITQLARRCYRTLSGGQQLIAHGYDIGKVQIVNVTAAVVAASSGAVQPAAQIDHRRIGVRFQIILHLKSKVILPHGHLQ